MQNFRFDPISFLIGFISGTALAFILYRLRNRIASIRRQARQRAESARRYAARTADARYQLDIMRHCQAYHLDGAKTNLSDVLVEPRFVPGMDVFDTTGERKMRDVFHVVPLIHQYPTCYAPFNVNTLGISDLGAGSRHLALLGGLGSGRSTALAAIALWAMGVVEFEQAADLVQQDIDEQEAQLDDKERQARAKEREEIQNRALEQIERAQEQAGEALGELLDQREIIDLHRLMPILVHLSDVDILPEDENKAIDPAEPLVQAIRHNVRRVTAMTVPSYVYNRLNNGQALVLIDGLDDLPRHEQTRKLAWLDRFIEAYQDCMIIVTGPATGHYPLMRLGLTPIFLRPWTDLDAQRYVERWAEEWPAHAGIGRRHAPPPDVKMVRLAVDNPRGITPLDLNLRIHRLYGVDIADGEPAIDRWDLYYARVTHQFYLKAFDKEEALVDEAFYTLATLAAESLSSGPLPLDQITDIVTAAMRREEGEGAKTKEVFVLDVHEFVTTLTTKSGLMTSRLNDRYEFCHPVVMAFLAAVTVIDNESPVTLDQVVNDPAWQYAIPFGVARAPQEMVNKAVIAKLSQKPDLLFSNLFELAHWLPDAPADAPWRGEIFKRLAAALIAPTQFPAVREMAMAALVSTRDMNVLFILRQALRSTDAQVRRLGCIGLGVLGQGEAIKDLRPMLEDDDLEVQLAAGLALGAIGTEKALEVMVDGLLGGEESLRQAVAEALAAIPGEGHHLLHTAITSEDMMVRRAAVFGLARIDTPWALTDLYRALLEDDQWYVRSAAEQAFAKAQSGVKAVALAHPPIEELDWVVDWVGEHTDILQRYAESANGEGEDEDEEPVLVIPPEVLVQMVQTGDQPYRIASARTIGYLGYLPAVKALYSVLSDHNELVRTASYAALADLQAQLGESLPGVM